MTEPFSNIAKELGDALAGTPRETSAEKSNEDLAAAMKAQAQDQRDAETSTDGPGDAVDPASEDPDETAWVDNLE